MTTLSCGGFRRMFGGNNGNPVFSLFLGENPFHYDSNASTQLQLFGNFPVGMNVNPVKFIGNEDIPALGLPSKSFREGEDILEQQKLQISLNNICPEEAERSASVLNPNAVSTGLRLSYDDEERNSSVTSASGSMPSLPIIMSLGENLKSEIDRQKDEFDHYIRVQEEHTMKGVREMKQRHMASFLSAIEKGVGRLLREKELEIENMNRRNKELTERIKHVAMEAQTWHLKARYNESVVNVLKHNLKQAIAQGAGQAKEGCGDSEVDDAASSYSPNTFLNGIPKKPTLGQMACKACGSKEISMLLLPCRHLCLCKDCEGFIDICPACQSRKTASVQVHMS